MDNSNNYINKNLPAKDIHKLDENNNDNYNSSISVNETCILINQEKTQCCSAIIPILGDGNCGYHTAMELL